MKYLRITGGNIEYPFRLRIIQEENPNTSFPREMSEGLLAEFNVYPVTLVDRPAPTLTQDPIEQTPQQIDGVWTQVWAMVDVSPEEAARRQQDATDDAHAQAVRVDAFVQNFISMTPQQVERYIANNTANLGQTRALVTKMALMLLALARREYR